MNTPDAIRLAGILERNNSPVQQDAAAELRRLHAEVENYKNHIHTCGPNCTKAGCVNRRLHEQNQTLLDAMKLLKIAIKVGMPEYSYNDWMDLIDTAIAEVEGKI